MASKSCFSGALRHCWRQVSLCGSCRCEFTWREGILIWPATVLVSWQDSEVMCEDNAVCVSVCLKCNEMHQPSCVCQDKPETTDGHLIAFFMILWKKFAFVC